MYGDYAKCDSIQRFTLLQYLPDCKIVHTPAWPQPFARFANFCARSIHHAYRLWTRSSNSFKAHFTYNVTVYYSTYVHQRSQLPKILMTLK